MLKARLKRCVCDSVLCVGGKIKMQVQSVIIALSSKRLFFCVVKFVLFCQFF